MTAMGPVDTESPLWKAWAKYTTTDDYANTKRWAVHEQHTEGSLWAAFEHGFHAGRPAGTDETPTPDEITELRAIRDELGAYNHRIDVTLLREIKRLRTALAASRETIRKLTTCDCGRELSRGYCNVCDNDE